MPSYATDLSTDTALRTVDQVRGLGHEPPKHVLDAIAAHTLAQKCLRKRPTLEEAQAGVQAVIVAEAKAGSLTAEPSKALAAALALAAAIRELDGPERQAWHSLGSAVSRSVKRWFPALLTGPLREDYLKSAAVVDKHAPHIPLGTTDAAALRVPALRDRWLEAGDASEHMSRIATLVFHARNSNIYPKAKVDELDAWATLSNPQDVDRPELLTSAAQFGQFRSTLPEPSLDRVLEMSRRGAVWWLPTTAEQDAAAAGFYGVRLSA